MAIMTHTKFHFNQLMLTLIFGIRASDLSRARRTTEKAGPDRVKICSQLEEVEKKISRPRLSRFHCLTNGLQRGR